MGMLEQLFGQKTQAQLSREKADSAIVGVGKSATTTNISPDDIGKTLDLGYLPLDAQTGTANNSLTGQKRAGVPQPGALDDVIAMIKAVRSQYQVRSTFEDAASLVSEGFRIKPAPGKGDDVKMFLTATDFYNKIWRIALELLTIGWCVVYVSEMDKQGMPGITVLHNVTVTRGVDGRAHVFLKLDDKTVDAIKQNNKFYPKYWSQSLDSRAGIDITRVIDKTGKWKQGGAYFVSLEPDGEDVFPVSPLFPVLGDALDADRMSVVMGQIVDFAKYYLFHIKLGNEDGQDLRTGKVMQIQKDRIQAIGATFGVGLRAGSVISPGDVHPEHFMPEKSPFDIPSKDRDYLNESVRKQVGLPDVTEASSDAAARFLMKSYLPRVETLRQVIMSRFVTPFLLDMTARFPQMADSYAIWGDLAIQELATIISKQTAQSNTGGCSIQYLCELLDPDYDFDQQMTRKEYEAGFKDTVGNLYEPAQGLAGKAENANPDAPNPDGTPDKTAQPKKPKVQDPKTQQSKPAGKPGRPSL